MRATYGAAPQRHMRGGGMRQEAGNMAAGGACFSTPGIAAERDKRTFRKDTLQYRCYAALYARTRGEVVTSAPFTLYAVYC